MSKLTKRRVVMKKRILAIVMSLLLVASVLPLSGCGEKAGDMIKITYWSASGSEKSTLEQIVNDYNKGPGKKAGVQVELVITTDNTKNIDIAQQNDQLPDLCSPTYTQRELFAKQGDIVPIESFEGGKEFLEEYDTPVVEKRNAFDGKVYSVYTDVQTAGLIYNKDLFKAAGLVDENGEAKPPKTWDELREYAKKLTDPSQNVYGYSFPYKFSTYYTINAPFAKSIIPSSELTDYENLTVAPGNFNEVFDLMMAMQKDGSLFPGADTLDNDTSRAYFSAGKIGMMPGISWDTGVLTTQFVAQCDWGVAPMPVKDSENTYPAYSTLAGGPVLTKTALTHPEAAFDFYKYIHSDEVLIRLANETGTLPYKEDLIEKATEMDEHAKQFRALYDENYDRTVYPTYTIEGDSSADMYKKVWSGQMSSQEAARILAENSQQGLRKAVESGKIDVTPFIKK